MCKVRATMNHEKTCPTQVLTLSTKSNSFCMTDDLRRYGGRSLFFRFCHIPDGDPKKTPSEVGGWCFRRAVRRQAFLARRLLAEVIIIRHDPADVGIEVPAHGALGILALRFDDFLPQRVLGRLLGVDLVEDLELLLQDRVGGLVELH